MITRFAPSPTGPLHLGHAYSAWRAFELAQSLGGAFLLRIEDIDQSRARAHWEEQIYQDLEWLGMNWPTPVMRQSDRQTAYEAALDHLWDQGLLYACGCNRRDIAQAVSAPQEGGNPVPPMGPDGVIYPGTCRGLARPAERPGDVNLRLDMAKAAELVKPCGFHEIAPDQKHAINPKRMIETVGDIVVARRDMATSYHLAVVVDDAAQKVTHVVRGEDLREATQIHVVLQKLLGYETPCYLHHRLIRDADGKRLAKRDDAKAIQLFRDQGQTPEMIRGALGLGYTPARRSGP